MQYASHLGWLNSTLKRKKGKSEETVSKAEYFGSKAWLCETPKLDGLEYLAEMWEDLGRFKSNGFGLEKINWSDVCAYVEINGIANWEAILIHAMSKAFVDAKNAFAEIDCEPPYLVDGLRYADLKAQAADARMLELKPSQ